MKTLLLISQFWIIIAALIALALLFVLTPLLRSQSQRNKIFILLFVPVFSILSLFLYAQWGASEKLIDDVALKQLSVEIAKMAQDPDAPKEEIIEKFDRIEEKIGYSAPALTQLAGVYNQLGLFDKAIKTIAEAIVIQPDVPEYQVQWIYSHSLRDQGHLAPDIRIQAEKLVQKDNTQKELLNLLAIDDYLKGKYPQAIQAWQLLLETDESLTDEKRNALQKAIATAENHFGQKSAANKTQDIVFQVKVTIASDIKQKLDPDDTVFIYVKRSKGSEMPLAVVKKRVSDLPCTVYLDNKQSMMPGNEFTLGMDVLVVAKVSKSGDPLNKVGDSRGISDSIVIKSGLHPVDITINERLG
ncbi:MAG: hypothetical protein HYX61_03900 [Gammaproteobacteria bacterium]|jgi:cytochrome c-type biogenesis protein CcmH|nr:hypothetical protein [Gammaproteobacteria bacterium]